MDPVPPFHEAGGNDFDFMDEPSFVENPSSPVFPNTQGNIVDLGDLSASTPGGIPVYDGTWAQSEPTTTTGPGFEISQLDFILPSEYPDDMGSENFSADLGLQYPVQPLAGPYDNAAPAAPLAQAGQQLDSSWCEWVQNDVPPLLPAPGTNWTQPAMSEDGLRASPVVLEHPGSAVPSLLPSPPLTDSPPARPSTITPAQPRPGCEISASSKKTCSKCGHGFVDSSALSKHKKTHREAAFPCSYCEEEGKAGHLFSRTDNYKRHVRREVGKKPVCEGLKAKDAKSVAVWVYGGTRVVKGKGEVRYEIPSDFKLRLRSDHGGRHGQNGNGRRR